MILGTWKPILKRHFFSESCRVNMTGGYYNIKYLPFRKFKNEFYSRCRVKIYISSYFCLK